MCWKIETDKRTQTAHSRSRIDIEDYPPSIWQVLILVCSESTGWWRVPVHDTVWYFVRHATQRSAQWTVQVATRRGSRSLAPWPLGKLVSVTHFWLWSKLPRQYTANIFHVVLTCIRAFTIGKYEANDFEVTVEFDKGGFQGGRGNARVGQALGVAMWVVEHRHRLLGTVLCVRVFMDCCLLVCREQSGMSRIFSRS